MKAIFTLLLIITCLFTASSLSAQEQPRSSSSAGDGTQQVAVSAQVSMDNMGIRRYLLGPGDTLEIRVFGQPDLSSSQIEVDSDGNITLPFIDKPIRARCRSDKDLKAEITEAYMKMIKNPQVSVRVTGRNSRPPAIIYGAIRVPQRLAMQRRVRLSEVIAVSGGITEQANGTIQIFHTEPLLCPEPGEDPVTLVASDGGPLTPYDLYRVPDLLTGKPEANPWIRPGDVVTIQVAEPVYITGKVIAPQSIYLIEGLTLSRAVAMVGGITPEGNDNKVVIYRRSATGTQQEPIYADLAAIRKKKQEDIPLKAYDVIDVPEAGVLSSKRLGRTILNSVLGIPGSVISSIGGGLPLRVLY
jgi:polysaccharide export outer membrane protein